MSTTIDEKVVEMRFDNKQFESNVKTSMSTLDKLKQSLNLSGAAKGLDNVNKATKGLNLSGVSSAVDTVHAKFSALEIMGVTALANITNSAVNCGKRMISALTIDPIKTGFQEYETQINSVQTILANTQHEGTNIQQVNAALDELNKYADMTIYNFTEMTRNIGTFTAAGVDLQTSVDSIKGIANLAAVSGSTSQQASTAMYQLSQALAAGKVSLMDWNSVVNAGMGGKVFQDALLRTSELLKTGGKEAVKTYGSFRESLTQGEWLTTEVLTETLKQFSGAYTKADLIQQGFTESQAEEIVKMSKTADEAATKVKTFTQLWDVMKEAAQSGWSQTWRLIIGDFEEAKDLLTPLSDFFTNVIGKISDARNNLLEGALNNPFADLAKKIEKVTGTTKTVTKATKDYGDIVDKVISGKFGNEEERWKSLTKAGYDWAKVQNLVNEKLGSSTRYEEELTKANKDLNESQGTTIEQLVKMSDAKLESIGFTKDEVKAFRELEEQSKKTGIPIKEIIKDSDKLSGRTLLINSFKNAGQGLVGVFTAMSSAWKKVFPPMTSNQLYDIIAALHKFSTTLVVDEEKADKLYRTFRGVISILKIASTLVAGPLKIAFKVIKSLLEAFNMDILDLTANVGDAVYMFSEWLDKSFDLTAIFKKLRPYVEAATSAISKWTKSLGDIPIIKKALDSIREFILNLDDISLEDVGQNIIAGLKNGLEGGIGSVVDILINIGKRLIEGIKGVLGIHSPSKVMIAIGGMILAGLIIGLLNSSPKVVDTLKNIANAMVETFKNIDWNNVLVFGFSIAMLSVVKKIAELAESISSPLEGLSDVLEGAGKALKGFAFEAKSKALKNIAISLAILVAAVVALTFINQDNLWNAVGIIAALSAILGVLALAVSAMSKASVTLSKNGLKVSSIASTLVAIGIAISLLAVTVKMLGQLDPDQAKQGFLGLAGVVTAIAAVAVVYGLAVKGKAAQNIDKLGKMLFKMSVSMLLMVGVVKLVGQLSESDMIKGAAFAGAFVVFVGLLTAVTRIMSGKQVNNLGKMLLKMSISMILLVGVVKLVGQLSESDMKNGAAFAGAFIVFIGLLGVITRFSKGIKGLGSLLLSISTSMLLMIGVIKLIGKLTKDEMIKGGAAIAAFTVFITIFVKAISAIGPEIPKVAGTILALSVGIALMAGIAVILSLIDVKALAKGVIAVSILGSVMALMVYATKGAQDCKGIFPL